jgi:hypothetical protein
VLGFLFYFYFFSLVSIFIVFFALLYTAHLVLFNPLQLLLFIRVCVYVRVCVYLCVCVSLCVNSAKKRARNCELKSSQLYSAVLVCCSVLEKAVEEGALSYTTDRYPE